MMGTSIATRTNPRRLKPYPANKQNIVAILTKRLRLNRIDDAVAGYDAVRSLYSRRIFPTVDGIRNTLRILERIDPKFARLKAENLVDDRIVRKLDRDGAFKWLTSNSPTLAQVGEFCLRAQNVR